MKKFNENDEFPSEQYSSTFMNAKVGYIVFVILYMILYDYFDTYTSSFYQVVVSHIQSDLEIRDPIWYQMLSIASLGLFSVLIIQYLADFVGRKSKMIPAFFGMGVSSMLMGFVQSFSGFITVFFFM